MASGSEVVTLNLSSQAFDQCDRSEAFHELYGREVLKLDITPLQGELEVDIRLRAFDGLAFCTAHTSQILCRHTSSMIDSDDPVFAFIQSGSAEFKQNGHETIVHEGDALLTSKGLVGTARHTESRVINLRISRPLISPMVSDFDEAVGKPLNKNNPALQLLRSYINTLDGEQDLSNPEIRRAVVTHFVDLCALVLGARSDAVEVAQKRGMAAARLRDIKACILSEISSSRLSLAGIAAKNRISTTYVRKLFETEGTNFTEFVLGQRLSKAYGLLTNPRLIDRPISRIAHDVGFNDLSYFNRTFRRAYGSSPSIVRGEHYRMR